MSPLSNSVNPPLPSREWQLPQGGNGLEPDFPDSPSWLYQGCKGPTSSLAVRSAPMRNHLGESEPLATPSVSLRVGVAPPDSEAPSLGSASHPKVQTAE